MEPHTAPTEKNDGAGAALKFEGEHSRILNALFLRDIDSLDVEMTLSFLRGLRRTGLSGPTLYGESQGSWELSGGHTRMRLAEAFRKGAVLAPGYLIFMARREGAISYVVNIEKFDIIYKLGARRVSREEIAVVGAVLEALELASMRTDFKLSACDIGGGMLSTKVVPIFTCPSCGSADIFRTELLYHKLCGYVGERFKYEDQAAKKGAPGELACPSCGRSIESPSEYKVVSTVYHCESCGATFSKPQIKFYCFGGRDRGRFVDMEDLHYVSYPTLSLSRLGLGLYESGVIEGGMILRMLSKKGYNIAAVTNAEVYEIAMRSKIRSARRFRLLRADFPETASIRWPLVALARREGGVPGGSIGFIAFDGVGWGRTEDIGQEILFSANMFYREIGLAEGLRGLVYVLLVHEDGLLGRVAEEVSNKLRILMGGPYIFSGASEEATMYERGPGARQALRVVVETVEAGEREIEGGAETVASVETVYEYPKGGVEQAPEGARGLPSEVAGVYVIVADLGAENVERASEVVAGVIEKVLGAGSGAS